MCYIFIFCFFKQRTAYEMRISDWSSDVCSSDLQAVETLPNNGRTNRAGPEIFAIRPDFHPGHHEAVGEPPGPESCHRGQYDARHLSEHGFISALPAPVLRRRQLHDDKRSEEHTSALQSLMRLSYAVFCLKKKTTLNKEQQY